MAMRWSLLVGVLGIGALTAGATGRAAQLRAPQNVSGSPGSRESGELATRASGAQMNGRPADALALAQQGIRADQNDPWAHYAEAMALSELGQVDAAAAAFRESERRFHFGDLWGRSVAVFGRAHAYALAGRCADARTAFDEYAALVGNYDPKSAELVRRYEDECRSSPLRQQQQTAAPNTSPAVPSR